MVDPQIVNKIDKDKLGNHILNLLRKDIRDREQGNWSLMRQYDVLAYNGIKQKATEPWFNASNFPVPLTATLLDTGHAHTIDSIWSDPEQIVKVKGVGPEDERTSVGLSSIINWQIMNDIEDSYDVIDKTVHRAFKHGNAAIKVIQGSMAVDQRPKVRWAQVPIENLFIRVNAKGAQCKQTDHVFELIPLDENDWERRKYITKMDGSPFFEGIESLAPGTSVAASTAIDAITITKDHASGTHLGELYSRDYRYMLECYLTYPFKEKETDAAEMLELIAWVVPSTGKVMNVVINPDYDEDTQEYVRPYSVGWIPYPSDDRFYGISLPWMIKDIQEELDYAHNQNMNAAEIAIKPPKFYRANSGFDPEVYETTPDSWHPIANPQTDIFIPTFNVNPIFERQEDKYWDLAERRTGFTELFQGRSPDVRQTATYTVARENKSDTRFKVIYNRFQRGFSELIQLTYFYDKKYMPDDVKVKVLGYDEYKTVQEFFPKGIQGKYNFYFFSNTTVEQQIMKQDAADFYMNAIGNPIVATSAGNLYKVLDYFAKSRKIRTLDNIITKPKEAEILSADEALRRIVSGEYDLVPDPNIDAQDYITKIQLFMRSDKFLKGTKEIQQAIMILLQRVQMIQMGQNMAIQDAQTIMAQRQMEVAMAQQQQEQQMEAQNGQGSNKGK